MSKDVLSPVDAVSAIAKHHSMSEQAISDYFALVLKGLSPHLHLFVHESREAIKQLSQKRLAENNRLASLALLTYMEAVFMMDYDRRIHEKDKSPLGRAFRALDKRCKNNKTARKGKIHPSFEHDILELWKQEWPETKTKISDFKKIFKYRHWLAHGRYTPFQREWKKYDFDEIYRLATAILNFF